MKGLLPGLSNRCPGTIGSCQYRTLRPARIGRRGARWERLAPPRARCAGSVGVVPHAEVVAAARPRSDDGDGGGERRKLAHAIVIAGSHDPSAAGMTKLSQAHALAAACCWVMSASSASSSRAARVEHRGERSRCRRDRRPAPPRGAARRAEAARFRCAAPARGPIPTRRPSTRTSAARIRCVSSRIARAASSSRELRRVLAILPRALRPRQIDREHQRDHVRIRRSAVPRTTPRRSSRAASRRRERARPRRPIPARGRVAAPAARRRRRGARLRAGG